MPKPRIICIVGPTASGKSALSVKLAKEIDAEIISADSMQVYRRMDIGTAKPTEEEMGQVTHHLIDIVDPDEEFNADQFRYTASKTIDQIQERGKGVIVAGGTGLYIRALTKGLVDTPEGDAKLREELQLEAERSGRENLHKKLHELDPGAAKRIHPNNVVRVIRAIEVAMKSGKTMSDYQDDHAFGESPYEVMMLGIEIEREELYRRIEKRVDSMMERGLKGEVQKLLDLGYSRDLKPMRGVGYKEMCTHLLDDLPIEDAIDLIKRDSRRYAKRQMTWFRKEDVRWVKPEELAGEEMAGEIMGFLAGKV